MEETEGAVGFSPPPGGAEPPPPPPHEANSASDRAVTIHFIEKDLMIVRLLCSV
jgi:hypothetical protein